MQVFDQQKDGVVPGLGFEPIDPGRHGLIRHQARVPPGGLKLRQPFVGKANVGYLAQKGRRGRRAFDRQKAGRVRHQALALNLVGLGAGDARGAAQGLTDKSQRHVDPHGIAAADEQLEAVSAVALALEKLVDHARLAAARGAAEQHGLGQGLFHAGLEQAVQLAYFAIAAKAGNFLAQDRARSLAQAFFE